MICKVVNNDNYIVKIYNTYNTIDICNYDNIKDFVKNIFSKYLKKYNLTGNIIFNIFIDKLYGMIIEIKKKNDLENRNLIDIKIKFNLIISFLYEVDYFYLLENNITNQNVYYYDNKFYLEIINDFDEKNYIKLLDNSFIIYDDKINEIINTGIKLTNNKNI